MVKDGTVESEHHRGSTHSRDLLRERWSGPVLQSYAQNAEDIRLWRVLGNQRNGFYVDVGAGDPVIDSVTKLFYDHGWSGINIEPGPRFPALAGARPRDVNLELAVTAREGSSRFWVTLPVPELSSLSDPAAELPDGFTTEARDVRTTRLGQILEEHAAGRPIDFLKIDTEGAEGEVLASFDPRLVRPTVVVVEAIAPRGSRPNHEGWEPYLLDCGFLLATFDGINRFYVPQERADLIPTLAYPISALDRFEPRLVSVLRAELASLDRRPVEESASLEASAREAVDLVRVMENTVSWRITRPLRWVRRRRTHAEPDDAKSREAVADIEKAYAERLLQVCAAVGESRVQRESMATSTIAGALLELERALASSRYPASVNAWLCLVAADGRYPEEDEVDGATRLCRTVGPAGLVAEVTRRYERALASTSASTSHLDVVTDDVVVDVSSTITSDLHTGIQRVARETLERWIDTKPSLQLAVWDDSQSCLKLVASYEAARLKRWRDDMHESGAPIAASFPSLATGNVLVPLNCILVVPEVPEPARSKALRGLVQARIHDRLAVIGFDLIPIVAAETVTSGIVERCCEFLSLVKRADRVSAISAGTAASFRAFNDMLEIEGILGPEVRAHPLPTEVPEASEAHPSGTDSRLAPPGTPTVLVVGSHEPRKNHLAVLEAAERLWSSGIVFELRMIGGSEWRSGIFRQNYERLRAAGRPISVESRVTEDELWAAYRAARFSVFPSLLEGFGLPVAESLASGTPVITSRYGSMSEIAADGGGLLVDPRDIDDLERQMRRLLTDDELLERLRQEAQSRDFGSWDSYARDVWSFLVEEKLAAVD